MTWIMVVTSSSPHASIGIALAMAHAMFLLFGGGYWWLRIKRNSFLQKVIST